MAWIESHQALGHHPKTLRLATELRCSVPCAIGYLHLFWWWALDYAPNGLVTSGDTEVVARACMWSKKSEQFWAALLTAGFVEEAEPGEVLRIHDWMEYGGKLKEQRSARKESNRAAQARWRKHKVSAESAGQQRLVSTRSTLSQQPTVHNTIEQNSTPPVGPPSNGIADRESQCPVAPHTFTGSYAEHLATDPRHQVKPRVPAAPTPDDSQRIERSDPTADHPLGGFDQHDAPAP